MHGPALFTGPTKPFLLRGFAVVRVFLVLPDLSERKTRALDALYELGYSINVLVSYTILVSKPGMLNSLKALRDGGVIEEVMLDSGAYHVYMRGASVSVHKYANFASTHARLWDYVVAPDVPGDPLETIKRTREFSKIYHGDYVPVAQGCSVEEYLETARILVELPGSTVILGVGGLDSSRRRIGFISSLVRSLAETGHRKLHLFGVGARHLRGLAKRGLARYIASIDTTAWLAEIVYRRRTIYGADGVVEANIAAITGYLRRIQRAVNTTISREDSAQAAEARIG